MMNKETLEFLMNVEQLEKKLKGEDKEIYQKTLYMFDECARILEQKEQVIDKAIEYIKTTEISSILEVHSGYEEEYTKPLLEILGGKE